MPPLPTAVQRGMVGHLHVLRTRHIPVRLRLPRRGHDRLGDGAGRTPPPPPPPCRRRRSRRRRRPSAAAAAAAVRHRAGRLAAARHHAPAQLTLRGSVNVSRAGSRLLARAFARRGALTGGRSTLLVQVGRQLRASVGPGRVSISLPLNAAARRALRRNGRLAITLRLTVDPPTGTTYTATRTVILRAP